VLVAGLMLAVGLAGGLPRGSPRRVWLTIGGGLMLIGLLTTVSRGGLIAAGCALLGGAVFGGRWRSRAVVALVAGAAALGAYFFVLAPLSARQHLGSANSTGRTDLWKVAWSMFKAEPVKGFGSGNFQVASIRFVQDSGSLTRADLIVDDPHVAHNVYLELLADLGIFGLLAFLSTAVASLSIAVRAADRFRATGDVQFELLSRMLILAILGMLAAAFFISDQFSKQLWLLLALPPPLLAIALRGTTVAAL
jgi:O-antigen ligase